MKKKYIKKLIFLNRNICINNYNNYLIYSYLNNCNFKLNYFFLKKNIDYSYKIINLNNYSFFFYKILYYKYSNLQFTIKNLNILNFFYNIIYIYNIIKIFEIYKTIILMWYIFLI